MATEIEAFARTLEGRGLSLGMTIEELSDAVGIPVQTIIQWRDANVDTMPYDMESIHYRLCVLEMTMGFVIKALIGGRAISLKPHSLPAGFTPGMYRAAVARAADLMRQEGVDPIFE